MKNNKPTIKAKTYRINDEIKINGLVRLIYTDDDQPDNNINKITHIDDARRMAENMELDLVEINNNSAPPIVKIMNYSKFLYRLKKETKHKNASSIKEIQLSTNISDHDLGIKVNKAKKFIENGNKVRVVLTMKGRELLRREESELSFYKFIDLMSDISCPESKPKDENNKCIIILRKKQK